jgi:hypothetical protein
MTSKYTYCHTAELRGGFRREESMRVAMLVGMLMFNVIAGLYESGWALNGSPDDGLSGAGQVRAFEGEFPPPPSWP